MGGLYEARAPLQAPLREVELAALFAEARRSGARVTLSAGRRSFGEHFLPVPGGSAIDLRSIGGAVERLPGATPAEVVARIPAGLSFEALHAALPDTLPWHPPTGDRITLGGAISGCTHDSTGYLADDLRALDLLTAEGERVRCSPQSTGIGRELFELLPGSFGALGAITHVELGLRPLLPGAKVEIHVLENAPATGWAAVAELEQIYQTARYPLGRGLFLYGCRGTSVLVGDRLVEAAEPRRPTLPLTDEATGRNILMQGLANRFPALAHRLQPELLRKGRRFHAQPYGFSFYQRSYDRAFEWLSSSRWSSRLLRAGGIDPRLTVCHQTFVVAPDRIQRFLDLYFDELARHPAAVRRLEQQDLVRLPPCRWPLHAAYGLADGGYLLTASFSVRRGHESYREAARCLHAISETAYGELGVKVLLLKQAHCDPALLRRMHADFIARLTAMRQRVDPRGVLTSRLLQGLGIG